MKQKFQTKEEVVDGILELWDSLGGWIPGGSYPALAEILEVSEDRLLKAREERHKEDR